MRGKETSHEVDAVKEMGATGFGESVFGHGRMTE